MKKYRRKTILFLGILCLGTLIAGCGKTQPAAKEEAGPVTLQPAPEEEAGPVTLKPAPKEETGPVTLYVTRHGETMLNTTGRLPGWCDSPLTEDGAAVAGKLGDGLKKAGIVFDAAYSSDSGRAVETAELVLKNSGQEPLELKKEPGIREVCYGIYEGATPPEAYGPAAKAMGYQNVDELMGAVFGGTLSISDAVTAMAKTDESGTAETWDAAKQRVMAGLDRIAKEAREHGQKQVLVVSHGMAISAMVSAISPETEAGQLDNASITKIVYDGETYHIETINDMSYIEQEEKK